MINNNVTPFARAIEEDVCVFFRRSVFNLRLVSICERHVESKTIDARPEIDRLLSPRARKKKRSAKRSARLFRFSFSLFYFLSSFSLSLVLTVIKLFIAKTVSLPISRHRSQTRDSIFIRTTCPSQTLFERFFDKRKRKREKKRPLFLAEIITHGDTPRRMVRTADDSLILEISISE